MQRVKNVICRRWLCLVLAFVMVFGLSMPVGAASKSASYVASKVKSGVGKSNYPFSSKNKVTSSYKVMGASVSKLDDYYACEKITGKGSSRTQYILFVGKAKSKSDAKSVVKSLKSYISSEKKSMNSYLSSTGKKVFQNAKTGSSGKWCWAVMLKSKSVNTKAVNAIKKQI